MSQWREGRGHMPAARANGVVLMRAGGICPQREPMAGSGRGPDPPCRGCRRRGPFCCGAV
eukprot:7351775-Pyramimonas_sp.AAC.1